MKLVFWILNRQNLYWGYSLWVWAALISLRQSIVDSQRFSGIGYHSVNPPYIHILSQVWPNRYGWFQHLVYIVIIKIIDLDFFFVTHIFPECEAAIGEFTLIKLSEFKWTFIRIEKEERVTWGSNEN